MLVASLNRIDSPTEEAVKDLLWSIVSKLEARMDNVYPESGLHSALESAFRATVGYRGDYTVHSECTVDGRGDFAQKFDLLLKHNKNSLLLELKRLRPNGICVPNTESNFHDVSTSTRLLHFKQFTENISANVLRTYKISQLALDIWNSKGVRWPVGTTVADVESSAQRQALNYKRLLGVATGCSSRVATSCKRNPRKSIIENHHKHKGLVQPSRFIINYTIIISDVIISIHYLITLIGLKRIFEA